MSMNQTQVPATVQSSSQTRLEDDTYLKILQAEQEHTRTRWTVVTFFMSVSFAIFGFSFQAQDKLVPSAPSIMRFSALFIYWFAYLLFLRFQTYSGLLVSYMCEMENPKMAKPDDEKPDDKKGYISFLLNVLVKRSQATLHTDSKKLDDDKEASPRTTIRIHTRKGEGFIWLVPPSNLLLCFFGVIYIVAVLLLWYYGL